MNEPSEPSERPTYWAKCEEMTFAELRRFLHDSVESLSDHSVPDSEEFPRLQEELLDLCDMLKAKADALKEHAPLQERPTYDGPPHPGWFFTPSDELEKLYRERQQAEERVKYETRHGDSEVFLEWIKRELKEVEQKIAPVEEREERDYEKRLREYEEAREPYRRLLRLWEAERQNAEKRRETDANRDEIVRRTYRKVKRAAEPEHPYGSKHGMNFPWEFAAPGERTDNRVVYNYFREVVRRGRLKRFDQDRLDKILALPRSGLLRGRPGAGRYGYIALTFDHTEKILMDCPAYGNALFVLDSAEERLLQMNKQQLRASDEVKRIFHTKNWYRRVKQDLRIE
jgi:hypothetical protein